MHLFVQYCKCTARMHLIAQYCKCTAHMHLIAQYCICALALATSGIPPRYTQIISGSLHPPLLPPPWPLSPCRHAVLMTLLDAQPLVQIRELGNPASVYLTCMELIYR